ncbi:DUF1559 domain-containing protein [Calycomorphotria hydatis]|uniref:Type II secretion system protein G n=1 Tax=Calycomorphotria hydatis TaxID=2528027 RepID=A0A517TBJ1_9PLAN|nr:DUF1559 domain-containing protein [Calycomorphotria hydatis]QDT65744.1 Type II secretion system protein G precursor [Calycomorphotria hydatis]
MPLNRRQGFTLVELLVVIAIIAILIALLLPAVQQAREAARRSQCNNNLKQIALALHNYHDNYNMFPQGQYRCYAPSCTSSGIARSWKGFGWMVMILPYVEQKNIYDKWDFSADFGNGSGGNGNPALAKNVITTFRCPSDLLYPGDYPGNNYFGCAGSTPELWGSESNGIFQRWTKTRIRDVTDGTSNTIMLSENLTGDDDPSTVNDSDMVAYHTNPAVHFADDDFPTAPELEAIAGTCDAVDPMLLGSYSRCGRNWASPYPNQTLFNTAAPPNWKHRTCALGGANFGSCADRNGIYPPRSRHIGGVHIAMGDGSAHFVSENIDLRTWQNMGARNDGQVIGEF